MNNRGRKGCSNFTTQENKLLMELVTKYSDVIESSGNASAVVDRKEAWTSITRQFNKAATSGNRTWHQLKALYENTKRDQKNEDSFNDSKLPSYVTNKSPNQKVKQNSNPKKRKRSESKEEEREVNSYADSDEEAEDTMEWNDDIDIDDLSDISTHEVKRHDISGRSKQKAPKLSDTDTYIKMKISNAKLERKLMVERHRVFLDLFKTKKELLKRQINRLNL